MVAIFISWRFTLERELTPEFVAELESKPKLTFGEAAKETLNGYKQTFQNQAFRMHLPAVEMLTLVQKGLECMGQWHVAARRGGQYDPRQDKLL